MDSPAAGALDLSWVHVIYDRENGTIRHIHQEYRLPNSSRAEAASAETVMSFAQDEITAGACETVVVDPSDVPADWAKVKVDPTTKAIVER